MTIRENTYSKDKRVSASDKFLTSLQHGNSPSTPVELKQFVRQLFQMNRDKADELLSLPIDLLQNVNIANAVKALFISPYLNLNFNSGSPKAAQKTVKLPSLRV